MKKLLFFLLPLLLFQSISFALARPSFAIENPLSVPNNKIGIHILFVDELKEAAQLINSNGGDWGYVTIPIQSGDRDLLKWQNFMDEAQKLHVIPILRLATEGDYFNTKVWRKPTASDVLDFANFLNSLKWPAKNRYIIVFNEVNRGDEWGGSPNPAEYADILNYASSVFKSKNEDFFIIPAGLDNAAANVRGVSLNQYDFLKQLYYVNPFIFNQIDGISSHSYPNPSFAQPPSIRTVKSITSFKFEQDLVKSLSGRNLPVFITETGWSREFVNEEKIAPYLTEAFNEVWSDNNIAAITPFLLRANSGPFTVFSYLSPDGSPNIEYKTVKSLQKVQGKPALSEIIENNASDGGKNKVLGTEAKNFSNNKNAPIGPINIPQSFKTVLKWLLLLQ